MVRCKARGAGFEGAYLGYVLLTTLRSVESFAFRHKPRKRGLGRCLAIIQASLASVKTAPHRQARLAYALNFCTFALWLRESPTQPNVPS